MNLVVHATDLASVRHHFEPLGLAEGALDRCRFFWLMGEEGEQFGAYALEVRGSQGWLIAGVGGLPGHDLTVEFLPFIEAQLKGCDAIYIQTRRPGLIKKLADCGYLLDSSILVKPL